MPKVKPHLIVSPEQTVPIPRCKDLIVDTLGEPKIPSPFRSGPQIRFTEETERVLLHADADQLQSYLSINKEIPSFERAGARRKIYFKEMKSIDFQKK